MVQNGVGANAANRNGQHVPLLTSFDLKEAPSFGSLELQVCSVCSATIVDEHEANAESRNEAGSHTYTVCLTAGHGSTCLHSRVDACCMSSEYLTLVFHAAGATPTTIAPKGHEECNLRAILAPHWAKPNTWGGGAIQYPKIYRAEWYAMSQIQKSSKVSILYAAYRLGRNKTCVSKSWARFSARSRDHFKSEY